MPVLAAEVPRPVAEAIDRQARSLLLGRRTYVRAILAAVAALPTGCLPGYISQESDAPNSDCPGLQPGQPV